MLGTALLVSQVGLSLSLGAFLAGVLLADSEFRHELEADIEPFKGLLLGLFFISVGMSANLGLVREKPFLIIGLTIGLVVLENRCAVGHWPHVRALAECQPRTWPSACPPAANSPSSCLALRRPCRSWTREIADLLVLVVTASMILSPVLLALYDVTFKATESDGRPFDTPVELYPKVIIAGFGRFGQIVGRILLAKKIAFTALEANQTQVDFLRRFGNQVLLRRRLAPGTAARRARRECRSLRDRHRRCRGVGENRRIDPPALPASEDLRARTQSPTCFSADGSGRALHHPRNPGIEPGDVGAGTRIAGAVEIQGRRDRTSISRARRSDSWPSSSP